MLELCATLQAAEVPLVLHGPRAQRLRDAEGDGAMRARGCSSSGFESGDDQILKNIKKGATVEMARTFAKNCRKLGIRVHGDFIIGLPGETQETIQKTIDFAKELDSETIQVSIAHAYPGTELHEQLERNHIPINAADGRQPRSSACRTSSTRSSAARR